MRQLEYPEDTTLWALSTTTLPFGAKRLLSLLYPLGLKLEAQALLHRPELCTSYP